MVLTGTRSSLTLLGVVLGDFLFEELTDPGGIGLAVLVEKRRMFVFDVLVDWIEVPVIAVWFVEREGIVRIFLDFEQTLPQNGHVFVVVGQTLLLGGHCERYIVSEARYVAVASWKKGTTVLLLMKISCGIRSWSYLWMNSLIAAIASRKI